jgi:ATP-binding cassette subfamily F protein 3
MATVFQIQGISKSFGPRVLFDKASATFVEGQKVGFIGANGAGKTTIMRMITGDEKPDDGSISCYPNTRLGYLEQNETFPAEESALDYLLRVSHREPWECAKMASGFDLTNEHLELPFSSLSGGYQMRVRLTGIFLKDPNFLLLDEPTNYLDLQTILLLEEVLRAYRGALLLISHDREFLKNTCTHTLELDHQSLTLFTGDIEAYFEEKEARLEQAKRYNKKIQAQQKHLQGFVDRFRFKASKATQAQSKLKLLDKLKTIEIAHSIRTVRIHIPDVPQKKTFALECKDLVAGYQPDQPILSDINLDIMRGEHIAIVGENGKGKSTLLKTLAGEIPPLSGRFKWGHNIRIAYYAQHVPQMLPTTGTVESYLASVAGSTLKEDILKMAGNFLFHDDDIDKSISILSGGERARLCLAGIFLGKHDVLILDEPTNHLDFDTVEALGEALAEFSGTVLFVSHSRTFVSEIATTILEVKDGHAVRYPYPYEVYVYETKTHEALEAIAEEPAPHEPLPYNHPFLRLRSDIHDDIQKEKRSLKRLETTLEKLTQEKQRIHQAFEKDPTNIAIEKAKRLKEIDAELITLESEWFAIADRIEAFNGELKGGRDG